MQNKRNAQLRIERMIAISLLFAAAVISANGILHLAKVTEERRLAVAAHNYSAVRSLYARQANPGEGSLSRLISANASFSQRASNR
jgi:hypothetical protein